MIKTIFNEIKKKTQKKFSTSFLNVISLVLDIFAKYIFNFFPIYTIPFDMLDISKNKINNPNFFQNSSINRKLS